MSTNSISHQTIHSLEATPLVMPEDTLRGTTLNKIQSTTQSTLKFADKSKHEKKDEEQKAPQAVEKGPLTPRDVFISLDLLEPEKASPPRKKSIQLQDTLNAEEAQNRKCFCLCRALHKAFLSICPQKKESEPKPPQTQAPRVPVLALGKLGLI